MSRHIKRQTIATDEIYPGKPTGAHGVADIERQNEGDVNIQANRRKIDGVKVEEEKAGAPSLAKQEGTPATP